MLDLIYFVEGIFGAGKTTRAKQLHEQLTRSARPASLYYEHESTNLLDMTRKAWLSEEEFADLDRQLRSIFRASCDEARVEQLMCKVYNNAVRLGDHWWVALYKIGFSQPEARDLLDTLASREICGGHVSCEDYQKHFVELWKSCIGANDVGRDSVYEGALLHNPMIDLVGGYLLSDGELLAFYDELLRILRDTPFCVEYVLPCSVETVIQQAAAERTACTPLWIDSLTCWCERSPFGEKHGLKGMDGVVKLCRELLRTHRLVCDTFHIPVTTIKRE